MMRSIGYISEIKEEKKKKKERKIPFAGIELTSQRVRGLRGTSELPGRPALDGVQTAKALYETPVESATYVFSTLYVAYFIIIVYLAQDRQSMRR